MLMRLPNFPVFPLAIISAVFMTGCTSAATGNSAAQSTNSPCAIDVAAPQSDSGHRVTGLCIKTKSKTHNFTVELAETQAQQAKGLMFRTELPDEKGMLFLLDAERDASFWMKNTLIPLDIIFIRSNGEIENIVENTVPYSLDKVDSTAPVKYVLELRGGLTRQLGIKAGDKVRWNEAK